MTRKPFDSHSTPRARSRATLTGRMTRAITTALVVLSIAACIAGLGPSVLGQGGAPPANRPTGKLTSSTKAATKTGTSAVNRTGLPEPSRPLNLHFEDVTHAAGIDFHLSCGGEDKQFLGKQYIMDSLCGGVAVLDYDNDGWMDIYLVNGSALADLRAGKCHSSKLYHNNHDGTFTDVTAKAGLAHCGWGFGVAVGDYDNDGWADLYVTDLDGGKLYHNNGNGTFTDVTSKAHADNGGRWGTSVSFGDYDNDGFLDLYIANYVDLDLNHLPEFGKGAFCQYRGIPVSCGPRGLKGSRDRLYHNNGDGTFTDVTEKLGLDRDAYFGLGVLWLDYDRDGCLDLYVADDSSPSQLYHNNCKGGFDEVGVSAGLAYSSDGREQAGMGVDSADYDHDGWPDIAKINFSDDANNLYHNDGQGGFEDMAGPAGVGPISVPFLGFGVKFLDIDNDGWDDMFIANGHVNPQVDKYSFGVSYRERPLVFRNLGAIAGSGTSGSKASGIKFEEIGLRLGAAVAAKRVGRGLAVADFWNRGMQDVLMTVLDGSPVLLRNESVQHNHWIELRLVGRKSNRDGFGARVEVRSGGVTHMAEARAGGSYLSSSDPRLHFGLGARLDAERSAGLGQPTTTAARVDAITIRWPSGRSESWTAVAADQILTLEEGTGFEVSIPKTERPAKP